MIEERGYDSNYGGCATAYIEFMMDQGNKEHYRVLFLFDLPGIASTCT